MKKVIVLLLIALQFESQAQIDSVFRLIPLPPAQISAARQGVETKTINSGVVIQKRDLKKLNTGADVPYLLNQTPAVVVSSDAGTGIGYTNIRIRGADLSRINVNMNGIPINDAEGQGTFFVDFPDILSSANSITIERGVGTSKSGYGNFGGAISINNLDINDQKAGLSFQTDFGTFNTLRNTLRATTGNIKDRFTTTVRLSRIVSDGYIDRSSARLNSVQITSKYQLAKNTALTFNYLGGKEITQQSWNGVAESNLDSARTFNEIGPKGDGTFYDNQVDDYQQDYYQLFLDHEINRHHSVGGALFYTKGKGFYEQYRLGQEYGDYGLPNFVSGADTSTETDLIRQLWLDNDFYGGRAYYNYSKNAIDANITLNFSEYKGLHFGEIIWANQGIPNDFRWYDHDAQKRELNAYSMLSVKISKNMQLFGDLQVRNVNYQIDGFRDFPNITHDLSWTFLNPKLEWRYAPSKRQTISFMMAHTQKEPNRNDLEASTTTIAKPEQLSDFELNYNHQFRNKISIYSTLYYMHYKDQLVLTGQINDVGAYTRTNTPNSSRYGFEMSLRYKPSKVLDLQANLALSKSTIREFTEYIDDYDDGGQLENTFSDVDMAFSPNLIAGGQFSIYPFANSVKAEVRSFSIDIMPKYVSLQYLDNTASLDKSIPAYTATDVILQWPIKIEKFGTVRLRSAFYNVFNTLYENNGYTYSYIYGGMNTFNYYYPQAGFRVMFGLGLEF